MREHLRKSVGALWSGPAFLTGGVAGVLVGVWVNPAPNSVLVVLAGTFLVGAALGRWFSARRQVAHAVASAVAAASARSDSRQAVIVATRDSGGRVLYDALEPGDTALGREIDPAGAAEFVALGAGGEWFGERRGPFDHYDGVDYDFVVNYDRSTDDDYHNGSDHDHDDGTRVRRGPSGGSVPGDRDSGAAGDRGRCVGDLGSSRPVPGGLT